MRVGLPACNSWLGQRVFIFIVSTLILGPTQWPPGQFVLGAGGGGGGKVASV